MKAIYFNLLLILVFPALVLANPVHDKNWKGKYTKEKKINKEFSVTSDALLNISNDYGNIDITTWEENRVVIQVIIKTNGDDEQKVREKLNDITVNFEASSSYVTAKTKIDKNESQSWWSSWTGGNNSHSINMEINYIIKLPATNAVTLENDYGNISIDRLLGNANLDCDYGKLNIGELLADNNKITFDYNTGCTFDYIKSATINAGYSTYSIEKAGNLIISADYSNGSIKEVKNLQFNADYGSFKIDKVNNIQGDGDYCTVKLGDVFGNVELTSDYGNFIIERLTKNAGNVSLNGDYAGMKIGYDAAYEFTFNVNLSYAGFTGTDGLQFTLKNKSNSNSTYEGYNISKSAKNNLFIDSDYGSVKMNRL